MACWTSFLPCYAFQAGSLHYPRKIEVVEPQFKTVYPVGCATSTTTSAPNFYAAMNGSEKYGHMTTYELLSGSSNVTPIKFSRLYSAPAGKYNIFCYMIATHLSCSYKH